MGLITASIEENCNTDEGVPAGGDDLQYSSKVKERKRKRVTRGSEDMRDDDGQSSKKRERRGSDNGAEGSLITWPKRLITFEVGMGGGPRVCNEEIGICTT